MKKLAYSALFSAFIFIVAGCGGGGGDTANRSTSATTTGGTGGTGTGTGTGGTTAGTSGGTTGTTGAVVTRRFTVPSFGGSQIATVVERNMPAAPQGPTQTVSTTAANRAEQPKFLEPSVQARSAASEIHKDLPLSELMDQIDATRNLQRAEPSVMHRFQELPEGALVTLNVNTANPAVTFRKMNAESETVHSTILAEVVGGQPVISKAQALFIANAFDTNNPFRPGAGIYDQVRAVFGSEWNTNPPGGRDADAKINLVITSSPTIGGNNLFGFFRPIDEFTVQQNTSSNQGEFIFLNVLAAGGDMYDLLATAAHEFQHVINFNQKFGRDGTFAGTVEDVSLDEGKAALAEELTGFSLTSAGGGNRFLYGAVDAYLRDTSRYPMFVWSAQSGDYGKAYLLQRYLYHRFGQTAFRLSATSPLVGKDNISNSFGVPFDTLFRNWTMANLETNLAGPVPPQHRYADGFRTDATLQIRGIGTVTLPGPVPQVISNPPGGVASRNLPAWAALYTEYSGGTGNSLIVDFAGGADTNANLVLRSNRTTFQEEQ